MFIPDLFSVEEYIELGHVSNMPKEHKCICSRSEAFIPESTSQIEGPFAIMSPEWTKEAKSCGSIIQSYRNPRLLFYTIGDACQPQQAFYDPRVGVNLLSRDLADHISPEHPLTLSRKHLKWIDGQIVECQGILRVVPFVMETNKVYLDFHIFNIPEGVEFLLVGRPIEPLVNPNRDRAKLEVKVGGDIIPVSLVRSCNTIAEARPEQDPLEEAVCTI